MESHEKRTGQGEIVKRRYSQSGVTLIELMVVLVIIGILVGLGVGFTTGFMAKYRIDSTAKDLAARIRLAKYITITRNAPLTLVFNPAGQNYYAFVDTNTNGSRDSSEDYVNLDSAKGISNVTAATKQMHSSIDIVGVKLGGGVGVYESALNLRPPSGLPNPDANFLATTLINGVICLRVSIDNTVTPEIFEFRRITVSPVVGKITLWTNSTSAPNITDGTTNAGWKKMY